nr:MAG TPA_asm: hypothetical protein [Bacteriophage sp.]
MRCCLYGCGAFLFDERGDGKWHNRCFIQSHRLTPLLAQTFHLPMMASRYLAMSL